MSFKEFGLGIVIKGALNSSFKSSFKSANSNLTKMETNIKKLSSTKLDIKKFKELSKDSKKNSAELYKLSNKLKRAGVDTRNLDQDSRALRHSFVKLKKASKIDFKINGIKEQASQQKAAIVGITASLLTFKGMASSANNVLKAQGEIRSLGITENGIKAITKAGFNMSKQFGQITAPTFVKASYDIKSGISSLSEDGVKHFTQLAATTAVGTKSTIEEMTKLYALGHGIFREDFSSDNDFGTKFGNVIASAVKAFRTDGGDLAQGISNIGASAKAMGVSLEEELAIIGLSKKAFNSASEAGSGYRAFLSGTGKAQEKLGLSFIDSNGKMLPMVKILDKIKEKYGDLDLEEMDELKSAFGSDEAIKTITALLPKTNELKKAQEDLKKSMNSNAALEMAKDMDSGWNMEKISNSFSQISFVIGKSFMPVIDSLAWGLSKVASGLSWMDENVPGLLSGLTYATVGFVGLFTAVKTGTLIKLGYQFALNSLKKSILLNSAANYSSMLSFNRVSFSTAFATVKTKAYSIWQTISAAKTKLTTIANNIWNKSLLLSGVTLGTVGSKIKAFSLTSSLATSKIKFLTYAQRALNFVMRANPIGLIVTGLGVLAGGLTWAYNKFDWFKKGVDTTWSFIKSAFAWSPVGLIINTWSKGFDWLESKFEWFSKSVDWVKNTSLKIGNIFSSDEDEKKEDKSNKGFFSFFSSEEKKTKTINETENIENNRSIDEGSKSNFKFNSNIKKAVAPVVIGTSLAANTISMPEHKLNKRSLDIPTHQEIQQIKQNNVNSNTTNSTVAPVTRNYTINITIENASSNIDVKEAVKDAIKEIEDEDFDNSMEDKY